MQSKLTKVLHSNKPHKTKLWLISFDLSTTNSNHPYIRLHRSWNICIFSCLPANCYTASRVYAHKK